MNLKITCICFILFLTASSAAQQAFLDAAFEFQAYPTGLIPGVRFELGKGKNAAHLRLGYNWIRHRDLGKHEDERGDGFGFTLGYKRYFKDGPARWYAGVKNDIWFNEIEWKESIGKPDEHAGLTKITVVQPTIEAGFAFLLHNSFVISPNLAFGYEVNVKTEGEPTGEGLILLVGVLVGKRF